MTTQYPNILQRKPNQNNDIIVTPDNDSHFFVVMIPIRVSYSPSRLPKEQVNAIMVHYNDFIVHQIRRTRSAPVFRNMPTNFIAFLENSDPPTPMPTEVTTERISSRVFKLTQQVRQLTSKLATAVMARRGHEELYDRRRVGEWVAKVNTSEVEEVGKNARSIPCTPQLLPSEPTEFIPPLVLPPAEFFSHLRSIGRLGA